MTIVLKDESRVLGMEMEDTGFVCMDCLTEGEDARFDTFQSRQAERTEYLCSRCGKKVEGPPGLHYDL